MMQQAQPKSAATREDAAAVRSLADLFSGVTTMLSTSFAGGGAEGDLMRLMGWQDRAMLDRYGADLQVQRAIEAKRRRGEMY